MHTACVMQPQFLSATADWPEGFSYSAEFLTVTQEAEILELLRVLPFEEALQGVARPAPDRGLRRSL